MNKEEITIKFAEQTGFRITESDITTGKIVINGIEITSVEDWEKVTKSLVELQQENKELKRNCNIGNENLSFYIQQNKELHNKIDKAIEYIEKHKVDYFNDGVLYATEFDSISSPHYLLSILKDSDVDE